MQIIIVGAMLTLLSLTSQGQTKNFIDQPYLEDSLVIPNEIYLKIIISEKDTKDKTSVEELEQKMFDALKSLGINVETDLTTNGMASSFKSYLLKSKDVMKAKQYLLKVDNAVTATKVFIELESLEISNTSIDRVSHSDLENIKNQIHSKAVENAKTRAIALTKPLNQNIGSAIHITDNENYNATNQYGQRLDEVVVVTGYSTRTKINQDLPKIDFQKIRVSSNVNVKFMLK